MKRPHRSSRGAAPRRRIAGFSLVELMVAMLISLVLSAAALGILLSNRRVHGATEGLGRLQESARVAFELMARDIREAGGNPCDHRMEPVNMLTAAGWWADYDAGIEGFDGGADADSIRVQYFEDTGAVVRTAMAGAADTLDVNDLSLVQAGQILAVCGFFQSTPTTPEPNALTIFRAGKAGGRITHGVADGNSDGSFLKGGSPVAYPAGALIGRLRALEWYVGDNGRGGKSLYRRQLTYPAGLAPALGDPEEITPDVTDLQLTFLENGVWRDADDVTNWTVVTAVQVDLEMEAVDTRSSSVGGETIKRRLVHVIALRNKL